MEYLVDYIGEKGHRERIEVHADSLQDCNDKFRKFFPCGYVIRIWKAVF